MKHILSLGAGVQSSTIALMATQGEIGPMPDAAIFADTQAEPASVYKWLDWLEKQLPFPIYRITKGDLAIAETRLTGKPYLHRSLKPLHQIQFDPTAGKPSQFGNECAGVCGV